MKATIWSLLCSILLICSIGNAQASNILITSFNAESDEDTVPARVADTMSEISGVDIWSLQEVESPAAIETMMEKAGAGKWRYVVSESGDYGNPNWKDDLLAILYRRDLFRQVETIEYHAIRSKAGDGKYGKASWGLRGALFLKLQHRDSGKEFIVGNVHLKCCDAGKTTRAHQAALLVDWVRKADAPVILTGDFNIPIDPANQDGATGSQAFQALTTELRWLRPQNAIKTYCSNTYNSMLDHIYYTPALDEWEPKAEVLQSDPQYCELDTQGYSDHRPVLGIFKLN